MLSDLERDVLYLLEAAPGFEGAWRLAPKEGEESFAIAAAVRGVSHWRVHLEVLQALHPREHAKVWVFDPATGTSPTIGTATPLSLESVDRERACESVARRAVNPFVPEPGQTSERLIFPRRTVLVLEREPFVSTQLADESGCEVEIERVSRGFFASPRWWWSNRRDPPDVVVVDLDAPEARELTPSVAIQRRYVDRLFVIGDVTNYFPFSRHVSRPLREGEIAEILATCDLERVRNLHEKPPAGPCIVVVDTRHGFGRVVRSKIEEADVVIVDDGWELLDQVESRRVDFVIFVFGGLGDAARFMRFFKLVVRLRPELRDRVLFATDAETQARLDRSPVSHRFISRSITEHELRARLALLRR